MGEEKEVRKEDQDRINRFSRLHSREKLIEEDLATKQVSFDCVWKNNIAANTHAERQGRSGRDLIRARARRRGRESTVCVPRTLRTKEFDGWYFTRYKIGDSFYSLPLPEVQERLSASVDKINDEVTALEEKLSELREEMGDLKAELYGRFGSGINLEA
jgi:prefoldin subunit 4